MTIISFFYCILIVLHVKSFACYFVVDVIDDFATFTTEEWFADVFDSANASDFAGHISEVFVVCVGEIFVVCRVCGAYPAD